MARGEIHVELSVSYSDDPKVAALARWPRDARGARDLYVQMICYSKQNLTDGYVPAENLGKLVYPDTLKTAERQAVMLAGVGLIEPADGGWLVAAFLKRNKSRAEVEELSLARAEVGRHGGQKSGAVRRAEAKLKQVASPVASIGLNTETESKTESKTAEPRKRGMRIPDGWKPTPGDVQWQRDHGIPDALARREFEKFGNYWRAKGADAARSDWSLVWHNWLLTAQERAPTDRTDEAKAKITARLTDPLASAR